MTHQQEQQVATTPSENFQASMLQITQIANSSEMPQSLRQQLSVLTIQLMSHHHEASQQAMGAKRNSSPSPSLFSSPNSMTHATTTIHATNEPSANATPDTVDAHDGYVDEREEGQYDSSDGVSIACSDNDFDMECQYQSDGFNATPEAAAATPLPIFVSLDSTLSWYKQRKLVIGGIEFTDMAMALAFFLGQYHGKQHHESRRLATWMRLSRNPTEATKRPNDVYQRIPAGWLNAHIREVATAILGASCRQDPTLSKEIAELDSKTPAIIHAGTDPHLTANTLTAVYDANAINGRNLLGAFTLNYCQLPNEPALKLPTLLPAVFPPHARFLLLGDGTCSGIVGGGYTTVRTIPRLLASCPWNPNISATRYISSMRDVDRLGAIVFALGSNHIGADPITIHKDFRELVTTVRCETQAPITIIGSPPYVHCPLETIREANRHIKLACDEVAGCRAIDSTMVFYPPHDLRKFTNPENNTLHPHETPPHHYGRHGLVALNQPQVPMRHA